jgi:hypothetical protein
MKRETSGLSRQKSQRQSVCLRVVRFKARKPKQSLRGGENCFGQARFPHSVHRPSRPMMPMQLSSEHNCRAFFFFRTGLATSSFPQWGQNLAHLGAGFLHFSHSSQGISAPHSSQVSSIVVHFLGLVGEKP